MLIFVPYVISEVVVGTGLSLMLASGGAVNDLLGKLGLGSLKEDWLSNPHVAIWTLAAILVWKYIGFAVLLFLAGLQGIPEELIEAAADRRRVVLAGATTDRPASARPDRANLGIPFDHRITSAV